MPVINGEIVQYDIPEGYRELITEEVLAQFATNLLTLFPQADNPYTCFYLETTAGWVDAFTKAVRVQNPGDKYQELLDYYFGLEWYDFDMFNDKVLDLMIGHGILSGFSPCGENEIS